MRTNLQSHFGVVEDVHEVPDPWGFGITFLVAREGCREYQRWRQRMLNENPVVLAIYNAIGRHQVRHAGRGEVSDEDYKEILEEAAKEFQMSPQDVDHIFGTSERDGLLDGSLLRGWKNLKDEEGKEVEFSKEAALDLLDAPEWVDDDLQYGGQSLGEALEIFLRETSKWLELRRQGYMEEVAKNSDRSSDSP